MSEARLLLGSSFSGSDGDIGAVHVNLRGLEAVPAERQKGVFRRVVWDLDLLGNRVAARNGGIARVKRGRIDSYS